MSNRSRLRKLLLIVGLSCLNAALLLPYGLLMWPPQPDPTPTVDDSDADVRLLAFIKTPERRVEVLIPFLKDRHGGIRREAARKLSTIGPDAWPQLRVAMTDDNGRVRAGAVLAVTDACWFDKEKIPWPGMFAEEILPLLDELIDDPDPDVSRNAHKSKPLVEEEAARAERMRGRFDSTGRLR